MAEDVIASHNGWVGHAIRCTAEELDFEALLMASIENERDDPEPDLLDDPSPMSPLLSAATGASVDGNGQRDSNLLPTLTRKELKRKLKKEAGKQRSRDIRKKNRINNPTIREHGKKKYIESAIPFFTNAQVGKAAVASTGYIGLGGKKKKDVGKGVDGWTEGGATVLHEDITKEVSASSAADYSQADAMLKELLDEKRHTLLPWDGFTSIPISEPDGRIATILGGHADDPKWDDDINKKGSAAMEDARQNCRLPLKAQEHRRGKYSILSSGYSHGGGQTHPQNMANTKKNAKVVEGLNGMDCFQRVARFTSSIFLHWAPELYSHYHDTLHQLESDDKSLKRPFEGSVFPAVTYNLGPQTATVPHFDFANLPFGWCGITAFGNYDHTRGGHFVLPAYRLIIQFPAGSTILIPSSILEHYNVPTSPHEQRYSVTQYAAGALFRWVDYGLRDTKSYRDSMDKRCWKDVKERMKRNFELGLKLLPQLKIMVNLGKDKTKFKYSFKLSSLTNTKT